MTVTISKSRTYVAVCVNFGREDQPGSGSYYFRKFKLPEQYENNSSQAAWYYLNRLDSFSCIEGCVTYEDYKNIKKVR